MTKKKLSYSIWAKFSKQDEKILNKIKKKFKSFKGPNFDLHLTITSFKSNDEKIIINKIKKNIKFLKIFDIETKNFGISKKFFQSIFLTVKKKKEITLFKKQIDRILEINRKRYFPHISLYYGKQTEISKKKIIRKIKNFNNYLISIKQVYLVINDEDNLRWKTVKKFNLS